MSSQAKKKILFFKNIADIAEDNKMRTDLSLATFYLASSISQDDNFDILLSENYLADNSDEFNTQKKEFAKYLDENKDIYFVCLTLLEGYYPQFQEFVEIIKKKTKALILVGGLMPTLSPEHVFYNTPQIDFLVRGEGEDVLNQMLKYLKNIKFGKNLDKSSIDKLNEINGLIFRHKEKVYKNNLEQINFNKNFKLADLNFDFCQKQDFIDGLKLFSSRGCLNYCSFCTSFLHHNYTSFSYDDLIKVLDNYKNKLRQWFGNIDNVPQKYFKISFYDDDFLVDRKRAIKFLNYIKENSYFYLGFFQTSINSFFKRDKNQYTDELDYQILDSISNDLFKNNSFNKSDFNIYIGTENFVNKELKYLNKGYNYEKIEKVVSELSQRKIYQAHHFIFSNMESQLEDILENLIKISQLKIKYQPYFNILLPVIPNLVTLFPSINYKKVLNNGQEKFLQIKQHIKNDRHPQFSYPLVKRDIVIDKDVDSLSQKINEHIDDSQDNLFIKALEEIMLFLITAYEKLSFLDKDSKRILKLKNIIEKYKDYQKIIKEPINNSKLIPDCFSSIRDNMQVMLTRQCQLRCEYCPVNKNDQDMSEETLIEAIDFLFTSKRNDLRLDFLGGEPILKFDLLKRGVDYSQRKARETGKNISYFMITNGIAITRDVVDYLSQIDILLEFSVDGNEVTHNRHKIPCNNINPYQETVKNLQYFFSKNIKNYAIMVVSPQTVDKLLHNFTHLINLGFRSIDINYSFGLYWQEKYIKKFIEQLNKLKKIYKPYIEVNKIHLGNLDCKEEPAILNSEIMVDIDRSIHLLSEWLFEKDYLAGKQYITLGTLDNIKCFDEIYFSKFHSYKYLIDLYTDKNKELKEIIINNIYFGNLLANYFKNF
jgi:sulfatase maturation enzyme AslB (radical SAM superfamily)